MRAAAAHPLGPVPRIRPARVPAHSEHARAGAGAQLYEVGQRGERRGHRPADRVAAQAPAKPAIAPAAVGTAGYAQTRWVQSVQCVGMYMRDEGMRTQLRP